MNSATKHKFTNNSGSKQKYNSKGGTGMNPVQKTNREQLLEKYDANKEPRRVSRLNNFLTEEKKQPFEEENEEIEGFEEIHERMKSIDNSIESLKAAPMEGNKYVSSF